MRTVSMGLVKIWDLSDLKKVLKSPSSLRTTRRQIINLHTSDMMTTAVKIVRWSYITYFTARSVIHFYSFWEIHGHEPVDAMAISWLERFLEYRIHIMAAAFWRVNAPKLPYFSRWPIVTWHSKTQIPKTRANTPYFLNCKALWTWSMKVSLEQALFIYVLRYTGYIPPWPLI
jgi:hypothetical protein